MPIDDTDVACLSTSWLNTRIPSISPLQASAPYKRASARAFVVPFVEGISAARQARLLKIEKSGKEGLLILACREFGSLAESILAEFCSVGTCSTTVATR